MTCFAPRSLFSSFLSTLLVLHGLLAPVRAEAPALFGLEDITVAHARLTPPEASPALFGLEKIDLSRSRRWAALQEQVRPRAAELPELAGLAQPALDPHLERYIAQPLRQTGEHLSGLFSNEQQVAGVLEQIKQGGVDIEQKLVQAGEEKLQAMVDSGLDNVAQRLQGSILPQLELSYRAPFSGREELFHANATLSLWESPDTLLFGQGGLLLRDGEDGANLGLGYRFLAGEELFLGVNTFYDWLSDPDVERWSVGVEARSAWLDLYANWYQGRGNDRDRDTLYYSPDGWDVEIAAHLPEAPWVELGASYYLWEGEGGQDDLEGLRYGLSLNPVSLFNLHLEYDDPQGSGGSWGVEADLNYQLGVPLSNQLSFRGGEGTPDLWSRRYEKVEREYAIRVRERRTGPAVASARIALDSEAFDNSADPANPAVTVEVPLPPGRYYQNTADVDSFRLSETLPGEVDVTGVIFNGARNLATLTLRYRDPDPITGNLVPITEDGELRITVDGAALEPAGALVDLVIVEINAVAPADPGTVRLLLGRSAQAAPASGCDSGITGIACVAPPATGSAVTVSLQVPLTPVQSGTCPTCQIALDFSLEFTGTALLGADYTVAAPLTLTQTSDPTASPMGITPLPDASSPRFTVRLGSLSTHYLNIDLELNPGADTEQKTIQLARVIEDGALAGEQPLLVLEPMDTPYAELEEVTSPLTETNLNGATVTVTLTNAVYLPGLAAGDFRLIDTVQGTVSITGVTRDSATQATLTLGHSGGDINADGTLVVTVLDSAHSGSGDLNAGSVTLAAVAGVSVTPVAVTVGENGGTNTYTLVLDKQPTADVTLTPVSGDITVATVLPPTLSFTMDNWDTPQTVTVTGIDDAIDNASNRTATVTHTAASSDSDYNTVPVAAVTVTAADNDGVGVNVLPAAVTVNEDGGTNTYTLALASEPIAEVTLTPASGNTAIATVSPPTLSFTPSDWNVAQTVTVTGIDDVIDNPSDRTVPITHTIGSADSGYNGLPVAAVTVTATDDDDPGVSVSETTLTVDENSGTGAYTVELDSQPTANVNLTLSSSALSVATVSPPTLSFTPANWNVPQTVTVTGIDDDLDNPVNRTATISHALSSSDASYSVLGVASVTVTATDDDVAGVSVDPTMLTVDENSGAGAYTVVLDSQPTANVGFTLASGDTTIAMVSPPTLSFTPSNWNVAQTVTVTGVNDDIVNPGDRTTAITHTIDSADGDYDTLNVASVDVIADDDDAGVRVTPTTLSVPEADGTGTYTLVLESEPTAGVTIMLASGDTNIATVSLATLSFSTSNWNVAQTVTVTGVNDDIDNDPVRIAPISHTTASSDDDYDAADVDDVVVTATDDDVAGVQVTPPTLSVPEADGTGTYTLALASEPTGTVTITPTSGAVSVAMVSGALSFTPSNWNVAQTVTVTGVDDAIDNNPVRTATISHTISGGGYNAVPVTDVTVTADDDDTAGVSVDPTMLTVDENSGAGAYTVVLDSQPTANVSFTLASGDTTIAMVSPPTLSFTPSNWNVAQTVTVTGVNDDIINPGDRTTAITHTIDSADGGYDTLNVDSVDVIADDDDAGVSVSRTALTVAENSGTGSYTLVLDSQPTDDATVTLTSGDTNIATVSPGTLSFAPSVWNVEQTVTVTSVNDGIDNPVDRTVTISHTVASSDGDYNGVDVDDVVVTSDDDDDPGVSVTPTTVTVAENRGTDTYTLVLDVVPTDSVTVTPASGDTNIATVSAALSFTTSNWNVAQTVTVTGVNDDVDNAGNRRTATITHALSSSGDPSYNSPTVTVTDVSVSATDDDTASVSVAPATVTVAEDNGTDTYTVVLESEPTGTVTITPASSADPVATVSGALSFTPSNWNVAQTVTVTGVNDNRVNASARTATISHTISGGGYNSVPVADVGVSATDDDSAGVTVTSATLSVPEDGSSTADYTLVLDTLPTANVTIAVESDTATVATVSSATLSFTPANWNVPQTVTVTGVNDDLNNAGDSRTATVSHTAASTDGDYNGGAITIASVSVTATDDDVVGVSVVPTVITVNEDSGTNVYTVVLDSRPTADVTITPMSGDTGLATVSGALSFAPAEWNMAQTVTVTGVDDGIENAVPRMTAISHTSASSDRDYDTMSGGAITIASVSVSGVSLPVAGLFGLVPPDDLASEENNTDLAEVDLRLSPAPEAPLTVRLEITPTTALGDYQLVVGGRTLSPAGGTDNVYEVDVGTDGMVRLQVRALNDADEISEVLTLTLMSGDGYSVSVGERSRSVTLADNDIVLPQVSISSGRDSIFEGQGVRLSLTVRDEDMNIEDTHPELVVNYRVTGVSADDYRLGVATGFASTTSVSENGLGGSITIVANAAGLSPDVQAALSLSSVVNSIDDDVELEFTLQPGAGRFNVGQPLRLRIIDVQGYAAEVSLASDAPLVAQEGGTGGANRVEIEVRVAPTPVPVNVGLELVDGEPAPATSDYSVSTAGGAGTLSNPGTRNYVIEFPASNAGQSHRLRIQAEPDADTDSEQLSLRLSTPPADGGYRLGGIVAQPVTLLDANDGRTQVTITVSDSSPLPEALDPDRSPRSTGGIFSRIMNVPNRRVDLRRTGSGLLTNVRLRITGVNAGLGDGVDSEIYVSPSTTGQGIFGGPFASLIPLIEDGRRSASDFFAFGFDDGSRSTFSDIYIWAVQDGISEGAETLRIEVLPPAAGNEDAYVPGTPSSVEFPVGDTSGSTANLAGVAGRLASVEGGAPAQVDITLGARQIEVPVLLGIDEDTGDRMPETGDYALESEPGTIGRLEATTDSLQYRVVFPVSNSTQTHRLLVRALPDNDADAERLTLVLQSGGLYTVGSGDRAQIEIEDSSQPVEVSPPAADILLEGSGPVDFTVRVPETVLAEFPVDFSVSGVQRADFTLTAESGGTLAFAPGGSSLNGTLRIAAMSTENSGNEIRIALRMVADALRETERLTFRLQDSTDGGYGLALPPAVTEFSVDIEESLLPAVRFDLAASDLVATEGSTTDLAQLQIVLDPPATGSMPVNLNLEFRPPPAFGDYQVLQDNTPLTADTGAEPGAARYLLSGVNSGRVNARLRAVADLDRTSERINVRLLPGAGYRFFPSGDLEAELSIQEAALMQLNLAFSGGDIDPDDPDGPVEEGGAVMLSLRLSADAPRPLQVGYRISGVQVGDFELFGDRDGVPGTAEDASVLLQDVLVLAAGSATASYELRISDDRLLEGTETLRLELLPSVDGSYGLGANSVGQLRIDDNDPPQVGFAQARPVAGEAAGMVALQVRSQPAPLAPLRVGYRFNSDRSNVALGADFMLSGLNADNAGTLTLTPQAPQMDITLSLVDDLLNEGPFEEALFELQPGAGYILGQQDTLLRIYDNEAPQTSMPRVTFEQVESLVGEGNTARVQLRVEPPSADELTVLYGAMPAGTAAAADYMALSGSLTVPPNAGGAELLIELIDDGQDEPEETLALMLTTPAASAGYQLGDARTHLLRIQDAQIPTLSFAPASRTITEGSAAFAFSRMERTAPISLAVDPSSQRPLRVRYRVSTRSSARLSKDYSGLPEPGAVSVWAVPANASTGSFSVQVLPDSEPEPDEQLIVELLPSDDGGYVLGEQAVYTLTIRSNGDDGSRPRALFGALGGTVVEGMAFEVPLQVQGFSGPLAVNVVAVGAATTAETGDYSFSGSLTLSSPGGEVLRVQTGQDSDNQDELLVLQFAASPAYDRAINTLEESRFVLHIDDNEPASGQVVQFEDGASSVREPERRGSGTSQHQVFLTRSATAGALNVSLRAVNRGGAQSSGSDAADYRLASNTVRFNAGQMRVPVQLTLLQDRSVTTLSGDSVINAEDRQEGDQTVELALLPGSGYQLGAQRSHRVRIADFTRFEQSGFCRVADGRDCSGVRITEGDIFYFDTQPFSFGGGQTRIASVPFDAPVSVYFCVYTSLSASVSTLRGDNPEFLLLNVERLPGVRCNNVRDAGLTQAYRVIVPAGQNYARVAIEIIDDDKVERGPGGGNAGHRLVAVFTPDPRYPYEVSQPSSYPQEWRCNADAGDDVGNAAPNALCRITDNDQEPAALPRVGFAEVGATVAEAASTQSVTVNLNPLNLPDPPPPPPGGLVVRYQLGGSPSLELDRDYRIDALDRVTRVGRLVVPPGASSATLDFSLLDNPVPLQGERVLTLALQPQEGLYEVAGNTVYTLTIQEDDEIGDFVQVRFAQAQLEVNEGSGSAELVVQAIPPPGIAISGSLEVEYRIVFSDTTALPTDYTLASTGTLRLSDGNRLVRLPVGLLDDSAQDSLPARELVVELVQPDPIQTYVVVPPQRATLVINDDDGANAPVPRVYFERADSTPEEGNTAMVRVVAVPPPTGELTVTYQRMPGGTATAGSDYRTPSGSLTILPQQGSALLSVELFNTPEDEPEETLLLRLLPPSPGAGYTLGSLRDHLLRIQDAQVPAVSFASASRTVTEAPRSIERGRINVLVEVGLTVALAPFQPLTVRYQVSGSAQQNQDYQGLPPNGAVDVLQIAAGATTHTLIVEVPPDELREGVETLVLELLDPLNPADDSYRPGSEPVYTLTINDDAADGNLPQVLFGASDLRSVDVVAPVLEVNEGEFVDIPVQVSAFSGAFDLRLAVDVLQSNAESGDYTLPAATRIDTAAGTVRLQTNQDSDGDDEVLVLEFANNAAYQTMPLLVRSSLVVYILDDEAPATGPVVQFAETSSVTREPLSNTAPATDRQHQVELTRSDTSGPLTVSLQAVGRGDVTAGNGDADADDYNFPSNMVTFAAGQSRTMARLDLFGNFRRERDGATPAIFDFSEGEQVVELALVAGGDYRLGDRRRHQVRIIDRIRPAGSACFLADGSPCCRTVDPAGRGCAVGGNNEIREGDIIYFEHLLGQPGSETGITRNRTPILQMPIEVLYCVSTAGRPAERSSRVSHRRSDNPDFLILDAQPVNLGSDPYRGQCSGIGGAQAYRVVGLPGQNRLRITMEIVDDNRVEGSSDNRLVAEFRPSPVTPVDRIQSAFPANLLCNSPGGTGESANNPFCVVIDNDVAPEPLPTVGFSNTGGTVSEDGGMMRIPLDISPASERGVVVDYALLPTSSALLNQDVVIDGVDGTLRGQVVLFGDGGEIQALLRDDTARLGDITLILELRQRPGVYQIAAARNRYTLIIEDDD